MLASVGVHVPVYAVLGVLSPAMPEEHARRQARGVPFEVAELGREQAREQAAEPVEPEPPPPSPLPRPVRRTQVRALQPSEEAASAPEETANDEPEEVESAGAPAEQSSTPSLAFATEGGTMAVAVASGNGVLAAAKAGAGFGSTGIGSGGGRGRGRVLGGDRPAVPLVRVEPTYPHRAARDGVQGWVRLRFDISPIGKVDNPVVVESHPPGVFERAVLRAVRDWKYRPMIRGGVAVRRKDVQIKLTFKLDR